MTSGVRELLADAKEALDYAELLERRLRTVSHDRQPQEVARLSALRESELDQADRYIQRAKAQLRHVTVR